MTRALLPVVAPLGSRRAQLEQHRRRHETPPSACGSLRSAAL